jgi:hypothetical protein
LAENIKKILSKQRRILVRSSKKCFSFFEYQRFEAVPLLIIFLIVSFSDLSGAQISRDKPLSLEQIVALIKANIPDSSIAIEIQRRGLDFVPDRNIIDKLYQLGAGPATLEGIKRLVPLLEEAKKIIPDILNRIYQALNQGDPNSARSFIATQLLSSSQRLDSVCKPFTYRAHYIESIIERPNRRIETRTRVLFQPMEERAETLTFRVEGDNFLLENISNYLGDWFNSWTNEAMELARTFFYSLKASRKDVLTKLVSSTEELSLISDPAFQGYLQSVQEIENVPGWSHPTIGIESYKGLKAHVKLPCKGRSVFSDTWEFYVDRIGNEYKIVKWKITARGGLRDKTWTGEDPNIEFYTLKRFESGTKMN